MKENIFDAVEAEFAIPSKVVHREVGEAFHQLSSFCFEIVKHLGVAQQFLIDKIMEEGYWIFQLDYKAIESLCWPLKIVCVRNFSEKLHWNELIRERISLQIRI